MAENSLWKTSPWILDVKQACVKHGRNRLQGEFWNAALLLRLSSSHPTNSIHEDFCSFFLNFFKKGNSPWSREIFFEKRNSLSSKDGFLHFKIIFPCLKISGLLIVRFYTGQKKKIFDWIKNNVIYRRKKNERQLLKSKKSHLK